MIKIRFIKILLYICIIERLKHINTHILKISSCIYANINPDSQILELPKGLNYPDKLINKIIYRNEKIIDILKQELHKYPEKEINFVKYFYNILDKYHLIIKNCTFETSNYEKKLVFTDFYYPLDKNEFELEYWAEINILSEIIKSKNFKEIDKYHFYILNRFL